MAHARRFFNKLGNFLQPGRAERDLAREIGSHLELLQDEFQRRGMNTEEARLAAKRTYGGIEQIKELHREARSWFWLEQARQDTRYSVRTLLKSPAFSLIAVLTLALGIGANTAIFSLIDSVMLKSLPVSHPEQLLQVNMGGKDMWGYEEPFFTNPNWEQLRDRQDVFSGIFAYATGRFNLAGRGEVRYVQGNYVSGQFFSTLGLRPIAGRTFAAADDRRGCPGRAVLSYSFWRSEYGAHTDAVGKSILLDTHPFEVVGVIGPGFTGTDVGRESDVYVPLCAEKIIRGENNSLDEGVGGWLRVIGRPKPGLSFNGVEARLKTLAGPIFEATVPPNLRPDQREIYLRRTFETQTAINGLSYVRSKYRQSLIVLMMIVGVVLLIACANVANLFLARSAARQREISIRMALGSGRGRLMRQLLIESMIVAFTGAALGVVFAHWGARLLVGLLVSNVYQENAVFLDLRIDLRVLAYTAGICVLTGLLFGLAPAWKATKVDPQSAMKTKARGVIQSGKFRLGTALVVLQIALSLLLVSGAGLMLSTFFQLKTLNPGFDREHVLLAYVDPGEKTPPARHGSVFAQMLDRLRNLPGARSVSYSDSTPLAGMLGLNYLHIDGYAPKSRESTLVYVNQVSDGYFQTIGTRLFAGRDFNAFDTTRSPRVAIVNQSLAKEFFSGHNPIGKHYRPEQGDKLGGQVEIIGVVEDAKYADLREDFHPTAYSAASQDAKPGQFATFELRPTAGKLTAMIPEVKSAIAAVDPDALMQFKTFAGQVDESLARERLLATLSGFFGGLALLLAMLGLYGVMSYNMTRRRNEIGIRMALGAQQSTVLGGVLREMAALIVTGVGIGLCATIGLTRFIASLLYGVKANDPSTLALGAAVLASVALLAGFLPAHRASRLDPMDALREE
jgi:putative ABC transport system permease protein